MRRQDRFCPGSSRYFADWDPFSQDTFNQIRFSGNHLILEPCFPGRGASTLFCCLVSWLCHRCRIVPAEEDVDWAGLGSWHRLIRLIGPTHGQCPRRLSRFFTVREDPSPVGLGLSHLSEVGELRAWTSAPRTHTIQKSFHRESSFPCLSRHYH
ncbi:hypothetical protein BO99DRAFT_17939 [Aspergillus violaceofuscus CBS 115571]|uniref:Uncharacterized protein n=1 Tax=Aspergillus violaceofuscus (strain CBS 115571) TaxID=1450538 RepID=A0A2V5HCZ1_ASPV1|nr:hypothetical protein BO99DRAFT_17939 [Aspergillus violaceofuscus CBS 115571]